MKEGKCAHLLSSFCQQIADARERGEKRGWEERERERKKKKKRMQALDVLFLSFFTAPMSVPKQKKRAVERRGKG